MTKHNKLHQPKAALLIGISLIIMALSAFFAYGYVFSSMVIEDNPYETVSNIHQSLPLFNYGLIGWGIIILTDLLVTIGIYYYLKPFHKTLAMISSIIRLIYTIILTIAVYNLVQVSHLLSGISISTTVYNQNHMTKIIDFITNFDTIWSFGLILFGVHLITIGLATLKTVHVPKLLSILLLIAGISYFILNTLIQVSSGIDSFLLILEYVLVLPMTLGELGFAIWLVVRGHKKLVD